MICKYLVRKECIRAVAQVFAALVFGVAIGGCSEEPETSGTPKVESESPAVYMKDPVFRSALDAQNAARRKLMSSREKLVAEMERLIEAQRAAMPDADRAAVMSELEKKAEWVSLQKRMADMKAALEDNRQATLRIVRERVAPKKVSK